MNVIQFPDWGHTRWYCFFCGYLFEDTERTIKERCPHVMYVVIDDTLHFRSDYFSRAARITQFGRYRRFWNKPSFQSDDLPALIQNARIPDHIDVQLGTPNEFARIGLASCKLKDLTDDELWEISQTPAGRALVKGEIISRLAKARRSPRRTPRR